MPFQPEVPVNVTLFGIVTFVPIFAEFVFVVLNIISNPVVRDTKVPDEFDDKLDV